MGFGVPLDHWFRGELKDYLREVLLDPADARAGLFPPRGRRAADRRASAGHASTTVTGSGPCWCWSCGTGSGWMKRTGITRLVEVNHCLAVVIWAIYINVPLPVNHEVRSEK